jgi:DNA polymerase V
MLEDGIAPGDLLVLNRTQQAHDGDVVVAYIDGGYTARWWEQHGKSTGVRLTASNSHYAPVLLYPDDETRFLGTVTYRIRKHGSGGWPIPEKDLFEIKPDLNLTMVRNRAATFLVRVEGDSMEGYGIYPTDILVVDRSQQPNDGDVVVAIVDGDFAVKYLEKTLLWVRLLSSNPKYKPIEITSEYEGFELWGKVTYSIHNLNNHVRTGGRQLVLRELRKGI